MKTKLYLVSLLFLLGLNTFSQIGLPIEIEAKVSNSLNEKMNVLEIQSLPYPIIFIHGLDSNSNVWTDLRTHLVNEGLSFGGRIDFCLNDDGNNLLSNKNIYPTSGADIALYTDYNIDLTAADFYLLNFDIDNFGNLPNNANFTDVLSNEAAIEKQGVALKYAIQIVLQKTGRNKVILMGHSMGGLASREYLQNTLNWQADGNHHVAKLITTGTPHGGYTGTNAAMLTGISSQSEAYRDLRKEYSNGSNGVFLYGGLENFATIGTGFYNNDINCNTINNDNTSIIGLNQKSLYSNLDYAYIMGNCTGCVISQGTILGDGVVRLENANLSNFYVLQLPKNEFIYTASDIIEIHSDLPHQIFESMQGLDEPNEYSLAYGINFNQAYKGFTTIQPYGGYIYDFDDFKFNIANTNQVNVNITNILLDNLMAHIVDINGNSFGIITSNGTNSISFSQTLPAGDYYLEIYGTATSSSYLNPYSFTLTNTLSTDNFELSNPLIVFPNPTSSKVFFDNSIYAFENVVVINSLGQELSKGSFIPFSNNQELDMSNLSSGIYMLKFYNQETTKTVKVIKK